MSDLDNSNMVHRLQHQDKDIILVGTAHVSAQSAQLVKEIISAEQPDTVCVELCESRFLSIRQKDQWQNMDIIKVIKEKKSMLLLANLLLASFQKRIAKKFDIKPGQEMLQAIDSAEEIGARTVMVDRDIRTTLSRTWRLMGWWSKFKLMVQLLFSLGEVDDLKAEDVEKMKQEDILESLLADVGKSLPVLRNILIDERDQYLSSKIKTAPGHKIVAVVGAGHVPGIKAYWDTDIDTAPLESLPPASKTFAVLKWLIPLGIIGLVIAGFFYGGTQTGTDMIKGWVLVNGILAGLGAIVALAHPLTIVSSIVAAPLTSLNPMVAAGWVSGLVEAFSRKPRVIDFEMLQEDIHSMRGFWRNKVTRVLLVVVFTNLGSSVGTFVAIPLMVKIM
jgi:pheromone shutdown-related protein TraB